MIGEDVGVGGGGEREGGLGGAEEAEPPLGDEGRWREALEYFLYELVAQDCIHNLISLCFLRCKAQSCSSWASFTHLLPRPVKSINLFTILSYDMRTLHLIDECNKK